VSSQAHTHSLRGPCRSHQPVQKYRFRYHNRRELLTVVSINELPGTQLLENTVLSIKKLATRKGKTGQFVSPPKHGGFHDQKPPMPYAAVRTPRGRPRCDSLIRCSKNRGGDHPVGTLLLQNALHPSRPTVWRHWCAAWGTTLAPLPPSRCRSCAEPSPANRLVPPRAPPSHAR
jgi:hypothetical protein